MKIRGLHGRFVKGPQESPRLCFCGCGQWANVYKGKAKKYISHHNIRVANPFKGKAHGEKAKKIMSDKKLGRIPWNFKGGVGTERHKLMQQKEYILWRIAVFTRDDYTCQMCHERGGKLEADHIKPWSLYPELRYAIDNGRTLCKSCHRNTETWGYTKQIRRMYA